MYFKNRAEAGRQLAAKLKQYKNSQCAIVALNNGGVLVAAQIAMRLHANLMVLTSDKIILPGESEPLATMTTSTFTFNKKYSQGEIDEFVGEYHGTIEDQRVEKFHKINRLLSDGGDIDPKLLRHHVVILVSDALQTGVSLEVAADFLKPTKLEKLIIATPVASVNAVDRMHLVGDEVYCLSVGENLMESDHYYEDNIMPGHEEALKIIRNISMNWDRA
jgi:putative phosphoribosyl transferase